MAGRRFCVENFDVGRYAYLSELQKASFAWEWVRRHPATRTAALRQRASPPIEIAVAHATTVHRLRRRFTDAEQLGLVWIPDPEIDARGATPFWLPQLSSRTPKLEFEARHGSALDDRHLADLPGEKHILIRPSRKPVLLVMSGGYIGAFEVVGGWRAAFQRSRLTLRIVAFEETRQQLSMAQTFWNAVEGSSSALWSERSYDPTRLQRALVAWDVRAFGGSHLDVAAILYGAKIVEDARSRGDGSLRERARRAFAMASYFINGGYRELLQ